MRVGNHQGEGERVSRIVTVQYALNPSEEQAQALSSHSGGARFAYNYVLGKVYENWEQVRNGETEEYLKITLPSMRRLFNQEKETIAPWWRENGKNAYDTGITNAVSAFQRYFGKKSELLVISVKCWRIGRVLILLRTREN